MENSGRPGLLDLLIVLVERKWLFVAGVVAFCVAGLVISLLMPGTTPRPPSS